MSTNFPISIDTVGPGANSLPVETSTTALATNHVVSHQNLSDAVVALETKTGVNSSAVTTSIDYLLKSTSSINPGHKHTATSVTLSLDDLSDVVITTPVSGNGLSYNGSNWVNSSTTTADASTTVKGVTKVSVAPVSGTNPIAVGDNDPRVPTQGENDALVGNNTDIAVGSGNKFITQTGLQHSVEVYAADSVGTDSYVITLSPVPTSYTAGFTVRFKAGTTNTGAATLNVNSLGAKTIKRPNGLDLSDGDILSGQIATVTYDGTNFQLESMKANPVGNRIDINNTGFTGGNTTAEQTIYSVTVLPGTLGTTNAIRCRVYISQVNNSAVTVTYRFKYGATTLISYSYPSSTTALLGVMEFILAANAGTGSQAGELTFQGSTPGATSGAGNVSVATMTTGTSSEDSTASKTLAITMQASSGTSYIFVADKITTELIAT